MDELRVGLTLSLSGRFAMQGRQAMHGLQLWERAVRDKGGLLVGERRVPLRIDCSDDRSRLSPVREAYERIAREAQVLLGPYASHLSLAAVDAARGRLVWNHGGASDDVQERARVVSVLSPSSAYFADLPAWLSRAHPEVRRIHVLRAPAGTFGQRIAEGLAASTDLPVQVDPIAAFHDDETTAVVLAASFDEEVRVLRDRAHRGPIAAVSAGVQEFGDALGSRSEGVIGTSQWEPTALDDFTKAYQAATAELPDYPAAAAFATGLVLEECLRRAGCVEDDALYEAATSLDMETLFGRFALDPRTGRQIGHRMRLVQWRRGCKQLMQRDC